MRGADQREAVTLQIGDVAPCGGLASGLAGGAAGDGLTSGKFVAAMPCLKLPRQPRQQRGDGRGQPFAGWQPVVSLTRWQPHWIFGKWLQSSRWAFFWPCGEGSEPVVGTGGAFFRRGLARWRFLREGWEPTDRRKVPEGPERSGVADSPTPGATNGSGGGRALNNTITWPVAGTYPGVVSL